MARDHRARLPVAYPDAPLGTCKHCGRSCAPTRRTHDGCADRQSAANDYVGTARRREGEKQRCVDCGLVEGQTRQVPGDYPGGWKWERVKIQRDHPQELIDNGPRDWTVPRCVRCHSEKTTRERQARERRRGTVSGMPKVPTMREVGRWLIGLVLVAAGLLWMRSGPPSLPDGAPSVGQVGRWLWEAAALVVVLAVAWWWWLRRVAQQNEALVRIGDAIARETHTDPSRIRLRVRRWRKGLPVAASCRYSSLFDDADDSLGRSRVETLIVRKVGTGLTFTWAPHRDTVSWKPGVEPYTADEPAEVERPDGTGPIKVRVEESVRATIKGDVGIEWGRFDAVGPLAFTVAYPSSYNDESPEVRQTLVDRVNNKTPGRWRAGWDTEQNVVRFERRPPMPDMIANPVTTDHDPWRLPFGRDESGREVEWSLRAAPHALVVGGTGSGKTVTLRSIITDAAARGFTVFCVDPKRIELTGLRGWPGVRAVASSIEEMIALVTMLAEEMDERYAAIEAGQITEADLPPVLVVIDEVTEFIQRANAYWKANKAKAGGGSEHPVIERWRSMARLGRSGRIHLVVGVQRPDAKVFGGEARDNYGFRVALGSMSEQGARMVFGRADVGRDIPTGAKGRATVGIGEDRALEVQTYYTPNPRECSPEEKRHLDALAAAVRGRASDAVQHINAHTIAAYAAAMDDPEAPLPRRPRKQLPANSQQRPALEYETVDVDDLADGDRILVDENGSDVEVTFRGAVESDDDDSIEVEYQRDDGSASLVFVDDDTPFRRRAVATR